MTALKPLENRNVRGVKAGKYPLNEKCAHPECSEATADGHHCFPRSEIGNSLWFVEIAQDSIYENSTYSPEVRLEAEVIPHVAGLCRAHHDDVEEHRAWIKLEDGEFVWYDRFHKTARVDEGPRIEKGAGGEGCPPERACNVWEKIGPLNPQPGSREGKPKRKRFRGEAKRKRRTISIKVPNDADEDGAGIWDDLIEQVRVRMAKDERPVYYVLVDVLYDWLTT